MYKLDLRGFSGKNRRIDVCFARNVARVTGILPARPRRAVFRVSIINPRNRTVSLFFLPQFAFKTSWNERKSAAAVDRQPKNSVTKKCVRPMFYCRKVFWFFPFAINDLKSISTALRRRVTNKEITASAQWLAIFNDLSSFFLQRFTLETTFSAV